MSTVATTLKPNHRDNTQCSEGRITAIDTIGTVTATTSTDKNDQEASDTVKDILGQNQLTSLIFSLEQDHTTANTSKGDTDKFLVRTNTEPGSMTAGPHLYNHTSPQTIVTSSTEEPKKNIDNQKMSEKFNTVNDPRINDMSWMTAGAPSNTPVLSPDREKNRHTTGSRTGYSQKGFHKTKKALFLTGMSTVELIPTITGPLTTPQDQKCSKQHTVVAGLSSVPPFKLSTGENFSSSPTKKTHLSLNDLIDAVNAHASIDGIVSSSPLAKHESLYPDSFQHYNSTFSNYTTSENIFSSRNVNVNSSFNHSSANEIYYSNSYDILDNAFKNKLDQNLNSTFNKPNLNSTAPSSSSTGKGSVTKLLLPTTALATLQSTVDRSITSSPLTKFQTDFPDPKPITDLFQTSSVSLSDNEEQISTVQRRSNSMSAELQNPKPFKLRCKVNNPANDLPRISELIPKDGFPSYRVTSLEPLAALNFLNESSHLGPDSLPDDSKIQDYKQIENTRSQRSVSSVKWKCVGLKKDGAESEDEEEISNDNDRMKEITGKDLPLSNNTEGESSDGNIIQKSNNSTSKIPAKRGRPKKYVSISEFESDYEKNKFMDEALSGKKKSRRSSNSSSSSSSSFIIPVTTDMTQTFDKISDLYECEVKKGSMSHPTRKKNAPPVKPPCKPILEKLNGKLVKVRLDKHKKKVLVQPRSKNGCWTCRIRKKKCSEEKPHCFQCLKLDLECDGYGFEKPIFMMNHDLQKDKLNHIKVHTSQRKKLGLIKYEDLVKAGKIIPANNIKRDDDMDSD